MRTTLEYVKAYDNVLDSIACNKVIKAFEKLPTDQIQKAESPGTRFDYVLLDDNSRIWQEYGGSLVQIISQLYNQYKIDCGMKNHKQVPDKYVLETMVMERYLPDPRYRAKYHVNVFNKDSSSRFITVRFYLNAPDSGGDTEFYDQPTIKIKPVQGSALLFPSNWVYLNAETICSGSHPKYVISTHLRYAA